MTVASPAMRDLNLDVDWFNPGAERVRWIF
jgi:hypothetical protein